jgi:hypothetical protein
MASPANSSSLTGTHRPTAFKKGVSGNPKGRTPGTRNKASVEAREVANRLIDDIEYRERLRERLIAGTAGAMEPLLWYYAKGKPVDRVEHVAQPFAALSDNELKRRLTEALAKCG